MIALNCVQLLLLTLFVNSLVVERLDGDDWLVYNYNQTIRAKAHVPGSIYSDLRRANVLETDLYSELNDITYRWVAWENWTYTKIFNVNQDILHQKNVHLTFHGLDTIGVVYLNGVFLGKVANSFVRYKFDVKRLLRQENNQIAVAFESAPLYALNEYLRTAEARYSIPPTCPPDAQQGDCHVNFVRKMQSSFSWDWGPSFPSQGIWKSIELEAFDSLLLRSVSVDTIMAAESEWWLNTTLWLEALPASSNAVNITLSLDDHLILKLESLAKTHPNGEASINVITRAPSFVQSWYPNGQGKQHLYDLKVMVRHLDETVSKTIRIGFRKIRLVQNRLPSVDESYSFYFEVNNLPIFAKGSNWIPAHVLHDRYDRSQVEQLLLASKMANMNMLRVWGGGVYEDDYFYQLADELGILIWHDMMFACALYPTDDNFIESVQTEIEQQVRRLQHHPSIALWAGNNENEAAMAQFWWEEIVKHPESYREDYRTLYIDIIKPIVEREDSSRVYLASSPSNGIMSARENYTSMDPQSNKYGDVHHYFFSDNPWNWKIHPSAKFVSEYGHQSLSSVTTLSKYLSLHHFTYPLSEAIEHREHKTGGMQIITGFIDQNLPLPQNGTLLEFEDFVYVSQINQAMAIKIQTEFYRRNRQLQPSGEGHTLGALYWQLNDIWPTISWSSIEFGGKWKMLHYYARRMFDNLLVDLHIDDDLLKVIIVRDDNLPEVFQFQVNLAVYKWSSTQAVYQLPATVSTQHFQANLVQQMRVDDLLKAASCADRNECFVHVTISALLHNRTMVRDNFLLLERIKNARGLVKANINIVNITRPEMDSDGGYRTTITLECACIAPFVWLDFVPNCRISGIFGDNGFMLIGSKQIELWTRSEASESDVYHSLTIKSLSDVIHRG